MPFAGKVKEEESNSGMDPTGAPRPEKVFYYMHQTEKHSLVEIFYIQSALHRLCIHARGNGVRI